MSNLCLLTPAIFSYILFLTIRYYYYYYMLNPCLDPEENRKLFYMD